MQIAGVKPPEYGLLVTPEDSLVPIFDTTEIHARAAVKLALEAALA